MKEGIFMASIRDVAKKAGVGPATVSRVLNNSGYVSDRTRERINQAMKELNYVPNELARNLFRKRAGIVAVIVPDITNPFFSEYVSLVEKELYRNGYKTMICDATFELNAEQEYIEMLGRHIVDGIITGVHTLDVRGYIESHNPIVSLDRFIDEKIPIISVDHKMGGRMAAEELIRCGCKEVIHFCATLEYEAAYKAAYLERHIEFEKVMKEHGITTHVCQLDYNRFDDLYYRDVVREVLKEHTSFDGVFGVDSIAIESLNECIRSKKRVPEDVKIVAYDGTYLTNLTEPTLTSIVQPIASLAKESVRLLMELMEGREDAPKKIEIPVSIRNGKSTDI